MKHVTQEKQKQFCLHGTFKIQLARKYAHGKTMHKAYLKTYNKPKNEPTYNAALSGQK